MTIKSKQADESIAIHAFATQQPQPNRRQRATAMLAEARATRAASEHNLVTAQSLHRALRRNLFRLVQAGETSRHILRTARIEAASAQQQVHVATDHVDASAQAELLAIKQHQAAISSPLNWLKKRAKAAQSTADVLATPPQRPALQANGQPIKSALRRPAATPVSAAGRKNLAPASTPPAKQHVSFAAQVAIRTIPARLTSPTGSEHGRPHAQAGRETQTPAPTQAANASPLPPLSHTQSMTSDSD